MWGSARDLFTDTQPGSAGEEEELFPLSLPPPLGSPFWHHPTAQRGMGIWQGASISLCLHSPPAYLPPKTFCTVQVIYHAELAISFLSADVEEAWKCVPSQEMSDAQEDRVK